LNSQQVLKNK